MYKSDRAMDPTMRPPAGYALTQPKGKWAWEKPARFSDPKEAVSYVLDTLEKPQVEARHVKMMAAGITIEEIVNGISMGGFMQGQISPDVAELIKGPIAVYLMGVAEENGIPAKVFSTATGGPEVDDGMDDATLLNIMRKRNPQMYEQVVGLNNLLVETHQEVQQEEMMRQERRNSGFISPDLERLPAPEDV